MDRPEPGLIKWSPLAGHNRFIHVNLQHRVVQLYEPNGVAQRGRFDYKQISKHDDFPALTTYDWSPSFPGLLAVGGQNGGVNLLRMDDNSSDYIELGLKMTRMCQAVAFNTQGLLAVGLERVRMDQSLHIWDLNRLSMDKVAKGFAKDMAPFTEPVTRLEHSASISSIKFFEDNPQTLVIGLKSQGLRVYDLRDPSTAKLQFSTRCNNNLAIDPDPNYFASSALDQPGVFVWDRRAASRAVASPAYLAAVDEEEVSWGAALSLHNAVETDEPSLGDSKHSLVRSLRYCRDHRGLLGVLTRTGQLKVLQTNREHTAPEMELAGSPELMQVKKSYEMDVHFADPNRKNERIVSFDWVTLGSNPLQPRVLVLRANGSMEILEQPSHTSDHLYKLSSWKAPHRGLEDGADYQNLINFEPSQCADMYGPLLLEQALSDVPIFGKKKANIPAVIEKTLRSSPSAADVKTERPSHLSIYPETLHGHSIAGSLRNMRDVAGSKGPAQATTSKKPETTAGNDTVGEAANNLADLSVSEEGPKSCRQLHEDLLSVLPQANWLNPEAQSDIDHAMLLRAKEKYLFDPAKNRAVVSDDLWLRYLWDWIADAEDATEDGGMKLHPLDLSYMGVATIWGNDLGNKPSSRLPEASPIPEVTLWEKCIGSICKKRRLPKYQGAHTKKPSHRQLCLDICTWGDTTRHEQDDSVPTSTGDYPSATHTMETARALFRGEIGKAVQILKKASAQHPELLFVSLALQLIDKGDKRLAKEHLDFDVTLASKTDPYLRAISSLIATGDWTAVANQESLPLSDRAYVAFRTFDDAQLTKWLGEQVSMATETGDIEGIVLFGITDRMVDVFAKYVGKFNDFQTATLVMSICAPRYIDDYRCTAWRNAYRAYLQRHKAFFLRTKFEVESTKKSKRDGRPTIKPPSRQIALRCVFCDAETTVPSNNGPAPPAGAPDTRNPLMVTSISAGISCPNCGRHLPRCVVCLEVVGIPRSDRPEAAADMDTRMAARFPTFCLKCQIFLLFQSTSVESWSQLLAETRDDYTERCEHFLKFIKHPEELANVTVDPLADDPDSPWNTLRQDEIIRAEIAQDVQRLPDEPFYHQEPTQTMIVDVLFIYCKLHPNNGGYRQGMHELLAPVVFVLHQDAQNVQSTAAEDSADTTMLDIVNPSFIEHDAFALFSKIMERAQAFYEVKDSITRSALASASRDQVETSAIVEKSKYIHEVCLAKVDPELSKHLKDVEILPQIFLIRWIRLLLGREFPFDQLLVLWDTIFAIDPSLDLIDLVCVAMLIRIRWQCRFIQQQGGVEAIFQGAAKNVLERGERLGINQAVRDAMGEIKRNVQGFNEVRQSPRTARQTLADDSATKAMSAMEKRNRLLARMLEESVTNLKLATSDLADKDKARELVETAAAKVQFVKVHLEDSTIDVPEIEPALAATDEKEKYDVVMEDSNEGVSSPVVADTGDAAEAISSLKISDQADVKTPDLSIDAMDIAKETVLYPAEKDDESTTVTEKANGSLDVKQARRPAPIPTRSTLAQSSFSWMLEPDQTVHSPPSSIQTQPSSAAQARKQSGSRGKRISNSVHRDRNAFLFGEVTAESDNASQPSTDDIFGMEPMTAKHKGKGTELGPGPL
ncbi:hypothetical protein ACHAQA_001296 [Verticillium albo-atrum]